MENNQFALLYFLTFFVSLLIIVNLWPYRFFPGAKAFFVLVGTAGGLCLISGIGTLLPAVSVYPILQQILLWGQLALPLAVGGVIFTVRGYSRTSPAQEVNITGLFPVLFLMIPVSVILLPIDVYIVTAGGWTVCFGFLSVYLVSTISSSSQREKPFALSPRRVVLCISAFFPILLGILYAFNPSATIDITPFAVILFALLASGIFQDELKTLKRLEKAVERSVAEETQSAWFITGPKGRVVDLDTISIERSGFDRSQLVGAFLSDHFPHIAAVSGRLETSHGHFMKTRSDIFEPAGLCQFSLHTSPQQDTVFRLRLVNIQEVEEKEAAGIVHAVENAELTSVKKEAALLEIALDATLRGVLITDHTGNILFRNRQLLRLLDLSDRALKPDGKNWQEIFSRRVRDQQRFKYLLEQILVQKTSETLDIFELSNGRMVECQTRFHYSDELKSSFRVWCLTDCTEQQRRERELQHLSMHDTLTGMYNRAYFEIRFNQFRSNDIFPISMVMIDVDGLKRVNDALGHPAGDDLLRQGAQILRQACRTEDVVARVGGDEFAILLPRADENVAEQVLTRIQGLLNLHRIRNPHSVISLSLGYAVAKNNREMEDLAFRADETMYENRRKQREAQKQLPFDFNP